MTSVPHDAAHVEAPRSADAAPRARHWMGRFELVVLSAYVALIALVSARHEPWKDETQAWRLAIDSNGLVDLYRNSRYEGHPLLFHVLLQLIGHVSRSWWAAAAFHVVVAGVAAWLVLRHAPFTRLQKALLVFGYWSAYEYSVVVRPYGLGMMLAFAACVAWTASPRRIVLAGVCLALLANTTGIGTLLAMTLVLGFAVDWVWPDGAVMRPSSWRIARGALLSGAVTLAVLWLVQTQVVPPPDAGYAGEPRVVTKMSLWDKGSVPTVVLRGLFPLAMPGEGGLYWSRWLFKPESAVALGLLLIATMIVLAVGVLITARRRAALVTFVVGTVGYSLFFGFFIPGTAHHHGYLFLVWVVSAWLAWCGAASERPRVLRLVSAPAEGMARRLFTCSLVIPVLATIQHVVVDVRMPFADTRHAAAVIRSQGLENVPIVALIRSHAQSVAAVLDRKVLYPVEGKTLSWVEWGKGAGYSRSVVAVDSAVTALLARECRVLVITAAGQEVAPSTAVRGRAIYTTPTRPMSGDRFRIWLLSAPASTRCPAGRYPSSPPGSMPQSNPTS